jgi:membrane protease subunit HflC
MPSSKLWIGVLVGIVVLASFSLFTVHAREKAILLQLGAVVRADFEPGLHFKLPFIQNVLKFDARVQTLSSEPELYLTFEKKNVLVDSFVKWRVKNVERFFTATGGGIILRANSRLDELVRKGLKDEFGKRSIQDVVSGDRAEIMKILKENLNQASQDFGIDIVDVRIKRIDLPAEVSTSVFQRMQAERQRVAKDFRSRGEEEARRIRARAEKEREIALAEAERDGQTIRGEGDAVATQTYSAAFSQDPEFYALYRSLNAYQATFRDRGDVLLLEPSSDFFRFFHGPDGKR